MIKYFEDFDWTLIAAVIVTAVASVIKEVCEYFGIDNINWLILGLKVIAAVLSVAYGVWKFYRLKTFIKILEMSQWTVDPDKGNWCRYAIDKSVHKKGNNPSVDLTIIDKNGELWNSNMQSTVDEKGRVELGGLSLHLEDYKLRIIIRA